MDLTNRRLKLRSLFSLDKRFELDSAVEVIPFRFIQTMGAEEIISLQQDIPVSGFCDVSDHCIQENQAFSYSIFTPKGKMRNDKAIILLHGLNERSWEKYLSWAETLVLKTGKPVILFPIAFHMNRTPLSWCNPRLVLPWVNKRKEDYNAPQNSTFVNVALSSRLSQSPARFYVSGKESFYNLWQLIKEIKCGEHPLFTENTSVNLFSYSIGALLSQVLLIANPEQLLNDVKLFMFCGGSLFSRMNGNAKDIMDQEANERLSCFMLNDFPNAFSMSSLLKGLKGDYIERAFSSLISFSGLRCERENFFRKAIDRIYAVSLKKDIVIPTIGIQEAVGEECASKMVEELDFPFDYSHQNPFPVNNKIPQEELDRAFEQVFDRAAAFL